MGASQSQEELLDDSDSDAESEVEYEEESEEDSDPDEEECKTPTKLLSPGNISNLDSLLGSLSIKKKKRGAQGPHSAKLYRHGSGHGASDSASKSQWIVAHKSVCWEFFKDDESDGEDGDTSDGEKHWKPWLLLVGTQVRAPVDEKLQMKQIPEQRRVDFVYHGVWAFKFSAESEYEDFVTQFGNCLFENTYMLEATESNMIKVYGKDFMCWIKPESADESIWEDAEDNFEAKVIVKQDYHEDFVESVPSGIQSLTMGALDHSFLVSSKGIETFKNTPSGIHSKGVSVVFGNDFGVEKTDKNDKVPTFASPKKVMLIKGESNLMVTSPTSSKKGSPHMTGVHQVDLQTGKVVAHWKFEKDGSPITMRDITNETKSAQLDFTGNSFLGLDDNRLCRWDMRVRDGIVQVLDWKDGHQFCKGTNFQCFATTGDGCIAVGSKDGKVRLYGTTSMRMAKTAFPGLGSPITHIDVTYDGKWVLATTNAYLILMSTVFQDKDGVMKTGFTGRMGNSVAAPRLLKLSPIDAHLAGKNYKFQGGQFTWVTESDRQERNVVASVGNFTVVWNFRRVKDSLHECYRNMQGMKTCYCYRVIPREDSIVDSKFMHDNYSSASPNAPLVVVTPQKISSISVTRE